MPPPIICHHRHALSFQAVMVSGVLCRASIVLVRHARHKLRGVQRVSPESIQYRQAIHFKDLDYGAPTIAPGNSSAPGLGADRAQAIRSPAGSIGTACGRVQQIAKFAPEALPGLYPA